jgi:anion-transporting  ArsA/GET3 family ATPase
VLPYEERKIAVAPGGGEVYALAIDPELALLDYLQMFYKLGGAGRALKKLGAIDFATTVAPGLRDVLLTGKACEAVRRKDKSGRFAYDYVVMDAPPTGRITRFLNVNDEVAGLAKIGPIHNQAQAVMRVLKSPETAVHLVTLLEEMPVQETADGIAELRGARLPVGRIIVNMVRPAVLDQADLEFAEATSRTAIAKSLSAAGLGGARRGGLAERLVEPLLRQAEEYAERHTLEHDQRAVLKELGLPLHELPLLAEGMDLAGLYELAKELRQQGIS